MKKIRIKYTKVKLIARKMDLQDVNAQIKATNDET